MGYKAEIRKLESQIEMQRAQMDMLYGIIKRLVIFKSKKGTKEPWVLELPEFDALQYQKEYSITTEPTEDNKLIIKVEKRKEETDAVEH